MKAEIPTAYAWLKDALQPHCSTVFAATTDHGASLAIGVAGGARRHVRIVESSQISLNTDVAEGRLTRESVVQEILSHLTP